MLVSLLLASFLTFVELNCENLFDCRHDSLKQDTEYLPDAPRHWTPARYWRKLNHIGQEILSCQTEGVPDLIALCEVENDSVVSDLTRRSLLRNAGYRYVMTDSPDDRGIDVALLYQPFSFALLHTRSIRVPLVKDMRPTRDILYASGVVMSGDTLHVFVVHAPSRYGGERSSRPFRLQVEQCLGTAVDSVFALSPGAHILIAGDFNDYTGDPALLRLARHGVTDISADARGSHGARGTYKYQGRWGSLDHIFVSLSLRRLLVSCHIHDAPFLLEDDKFDGGYQPRRTYRGFRYQPGYSDHLPLVARFQW